MHLKQIAARLTAALLLVSTLITPAFALTGTVTTDGDDLRLRAEANTASKILKKLANGAQVEVLSALENGWYQVAFEGLQGYVSGKYLAVESEAVPLVNEPPAESAAPAAEEAPVQASASAEEAVKRYVQVVEGPLNVRSGPGTEYEKVGSLATGRVVEFQSLENGWYRIETGCISADYVKEVDASQLDTASLKGQEIASYALQFVGYPYVYGGSSPRGFDCSGFTSYVYKQFGYSLNRTASGQLDNGTAVSRSELRPGDLVIFKKGNTSKRATHVGLYIGNDQFVHACTSRVGVIVSSMSSNYYATGFVGGRRIVN